MVGSILYDFTSWSCHACEPKQTPSHRWRCYECGRRAYRAWGAKPQWWMHGDIECVRLHAWPRVVELDFGRTSIQAGPSVGCVPYFKAFCWMKVWENKDLGVNGHRCQLPTSPSICLLLGVLPSEAALRMKSSLWMGLQKWHVKKCLPCWATCPRAFAPWHLHMISIRKFITWDYQQAFKVWLLVRISIRAWTTWRGQQAFKVWLLEQTSIKGWTT